MAVLIKWAVYIVCASIYTFQFDVLKLVSGDSFGGGAFNAGAFNALAAVASMTVRSVVLEPCVG